MATGTNRILDKIRTKTKFIDQDNVSFTKASSGNATGTAVVANILYFDIEVNVDDIDTKIFDLNNAEIRFQEVGAGHSIKLITGSVEYKFINVTKGRHKYLFRWTGSEYELIVDGVVFNAAITGSPFSYSITDFNITTFDGKVWEIILNNNTITQTEAIDFTNGNNDLTTGQVIWSKDSYTTDLFTNTGSEAGWDLTTVDAFVYRDLIDDNGNTFGLNQYDDLASFATGTSAQELNEVVISNGTDTVLTFASLFYEGVEANVRVEIEGVELSEGDGEFTITSLPGNPLEITLPVAAPVAWDVRAYLGSRSTKETVSQSAIETPTGKNLDDTLDNNQTVLDDHETRISNIEITEETGTGYKRAYLEAPNGLLLYDTWEFDTDENDSINLSLLNKGYYSIDAISKSGPTSSITLFISGYISNNVRADGTPFDNNTGTIPIVNSTTNEPRVTPTLSIFENVHALSDNVARVTVESGNFWAAVALKSGLSIDNIPAGYIIRISRK